MTLSIMNVHHNYAENFIDDPEYFHQYSSWLICEYEGKKSKQIQPKLALKNWTEDKNPMC